MKRSKPLQRKKPIRRVSKKRSGEMRKYSALRKQFLADRPICEMFCKEYGWRWHSPGRYEMPPLRALYTAERLLAMGAPASTDVHHRKGRYGGNYLNVDSWSALSRTAHQWIHDHPSWGRENGWLA